MLFRLNKEQGMVGHTLTKVSEWNHNYYVTSLTSFPSGERLAAGDAISSLSVLKLDNNKLSSIPRPFNSLWPVSLQAMDEKELIGSNVRFSHDIALGSDPHKMCSQSDCNLFSYKVGERMENDGFYNLDDFTNRFLSG